MSTDHRHHAPPPARRSTTWPRCCADAWAGAAETAEYDAARAVYNAMIDRRPAAIARAATPPTCQRRQLRTRRAGLTIAVRGGGHNAGGLACATTDWSSTCRR